jgi:hypothetical protein
VRRMRGRNRTPDDTVLRTRTGSIPSGKFGRPDISSGGIPARCGGNAFRAPGCHQSRFAPLVANSIGAIECGGNVTVRRPAGESTSRPRGDTRSELAGSLPAWGDHAVSSRLDETIAAARMLAVTERRYSQLMRVTAALSGLPEAVALREGPPNGPAESGAASTRSASAPKA